MNEVAECHHVEGSGPNGDCTSLNGVLDDYKLFSCEAEAAESESTAGLKDESGPNQRADVSSSERTSVLQQPFKEEPAADETKLILIGPSNMGNVAEGQLIGVPIVRGVPESFNASPENSLPVPEPADLVVPNFEGPCRFGLVFPAMDSARTLSVYVSEAANKVFLRMGSTIIVKFTFDASQAPSSDLYVRGTLKFVDLDVIQHSVDRCKVHVLEDDPLNKSHEFESLCKCPYYNLAGHVLRSSTQGAIYCFDPVSRRHSVLNPLKGRSHNVIYSFHCKSSCPKGIDRRPMQVVFTLELLNGVILGQTSLNVKVCTSPKRDRDRHDLVRKMGVKRRKVYYENVEAPQNRVLVTACCNSNVPTISMVDIDPNEPSSLLAKKIREKIEKVKMQLAHVNNTMASILKSLNDLE